MPRRSVFALPPFDWDSYQGIPEVPPESATLHECEGWKSGYLVPNAFIDIAMSRLTGAQTKVFLYICKRTLRASASPKSAAISVRELCRGTNLRPSTVSEALTALIQQGIIFAKRARLQMGRQGTSVYTVNLGRNTPELNLTESAPYVPIPKEEREILQVRRAHNRAIYHAVPSSLTIEEWRAIKRIANFCCLCCGTPEEDDNPLTIDHIVSMGLGGHNDANNCQALCFDCNIAKNTRIVDYRPAAMNND